MSLSRRQLLSAAVGLGSAVLVPSAAFAAVRPVSGARTLTLRNLHTEESATVTYWENGHYVPDCLHAINHVLRDHRSNQSIAMDVTLIDAVHRLGTLLGSTDVNVISGYRSPATNESLRRQGRAVAKHSYHLLGRAMDVRFNHQGLRSTLKAALKHHDGGVGYYPKERYGFIHLDTGKKRQWGPI